jgi:hypothetical protein
MKTRSILSIDLVLHNCRRTQSNADVRRDMPLVLRTKLILPRLQFTRKLLSYCVDDTWPSKTFFSAVANRPRTRSAPRDTLAAPCLTSPRANAAVLVAPFLTTSQDSIHLRFVLVSFSFNPRSAQAALTFLSSRWLLRTGSNDTADSEGYGRRVSTDDCRCPTFLRNIRKRWIRIYLLCTIRR